MANDSTTANTAMAIADVYNNNKGSVIRKIGLLNGSNRMYYHKQYTSNNKVSYLKLMIHNVVF